MTTPLQNPILSGSRKTLLDKINNVADLRKLKVGELPQLCAELRQYIIENCSTNPGHFASSMGAVEIIVATHYVFNTPEDHLIFDVGHQAYAHKILTGRKAEFRNQRTKGGISGFPTPSESEFDSFVAGHAGNSISAALGMAIADMQTPGKENNRTVALIGDASIGNGLAFEGLNNVSNQPNNLLIILNDNEMSIDANVGALHRYLSKITTSKPYNDLRHSTYNFLKSRNVITDKGRRAIIRFNNSIKALIARQQNIFEGLNIRYFGPIDGHDVMELVRVLEEIKEMKGPRILHIHTTKGKGYLPAEQEPSVWHAPGKFDVATGERKSSNKTSTKWQDVFGEELLRLAQKYKDVVGITAAMPSGTSLNHLLKKMPQRAFDVGISEGHAVTFAGGLAAAGKHPYVVIYSSFLQRAYDNIIHDVAIQGLPVTICIDRAGIVGEDGATHHGLFDLAYLRCIPNMSIASPSDAEMLRMLMEFSHSHNAPMAIRYPRGSVPDNPVKMCAGEIELGKSKELISFPDSKVALLCVGPIIHEALTAQKNLINKGISVDIHDMIWIKPLDIDALNKIAERYETVFTLEDGTVEGGFGSAVAEFMAEKKIKPRVIRIGVNNCFVSHASVKELYRDNGMDGESIAQLIENTLQQK